VKARSARLSRIESLTPPLTPPTNFVFSVGTEMVVVDLDFLAGFPQGLSYDLFAKGTVDKKD
jgi:hypothetical protein